MQPAANGLVPEYDEREAARFNGYTWKEWQEFDLLDPWGRYQRAAGVAYHRMSKLIEHHVDDAVNATIEAKSKQRG